MQNAYVVNQGSPFFPFLPNGIKVIRVYVLITFLPSCSGTYQRAQPFIILLEPFPIPLASNCNRQKSSYS